MPKTLPASYPRQRRRSHVVPCHGARHLHIGSRLHPRDEIDPHHRHAQLTPAPQVRAPRCQVANIRTRTYVRDLMIQSYAYYYP